LDSNNNRISDYNRAKHCLGERLYQRGMRAHEFNPVELNTLLYGMEIDIAYFGGTVGQS
jgi:hypothetical protein